MAFFAARPTSTIKPISTYPDFRIHLNKVRDAITPRTKVILFNSPSNPTGTVATEEEVRGLAELAREKNICLISDEIYRAFCYDRPFVSPAKFNDQTLVIDGFSKSHSMTGWRIGWAHGPQIDKGARWDPAELGPVVSELLAKARPAVPVYGA